MRQRQHRVELDGEPSIRCGYEDPVRRHAPELTQEGDLVLTTTNVLNDSARMSYSETAIGERQRPGRYANEAKPWVFPLQM
jgi:hypothetical protein